MVQPEMMPKAPECRGPENLWPEWSRVRKTDYGRKETIARFDGDSRRYQTAVTEVLRDGDGRLTGVKIVRLTHELRPVDGSEQVLACGLLLIAAGLLRPQDYAAARQVDAFWMGYTNLQQGPETALQFQCGFLLRREVDCEVKNMVC